jgi:hypothetical protein
VCGHVCVCGGGGGVLLVVGGNVRGPVLKIALHPATGLLQFRNGNCVTHFAQAS